MMNRIQYFLAFFDSNSPQLCPKMKGAQLYLNEVSNVSPLNSPLAYCCLSNIILQMVVLGCVFVNYNDSFFYPEKHSSSLQDEMLEFEAWC